MALSRDHGERIWKGDPSTVAEANENYRLHPSDQAFIDRLVALYSNRFRWRGEYDSGRREFFSLHPQLMELAEKLLQGGERREFPDRADAISTYLEWMARNGLVGTERLEAWEMARRLCLEGLARASQLGMGDHSPHLLKLTLARIFMTDEDYDSVLGHTLEAMRDAWCIRNPRQKVRVYAKAGLILRLYGIQMLRDRKQERLRALPKYLLRILQGLQWGIEAVLIRRVPLNSTRKAVAALLHIDR